MIDLSNNTRFEVDKLILPIELFITKLSRPEFIVNDAQIDQGLSVLKDFDVIVTRTDWELSNLILPGYWKHCGIFYGGKIYESTTHDVRKPHPVKFMATKDHFQVMRPKWNFTDDQKSAGGKYLESCIGESYDYAFELHKDITSTGIKKIFCSGYVYGAFKAMDEAFVGNFKLTDVLGNYTVEPSYYANDERLFEKVLRVN